MFKQLCNKLYDFWFGNMINENKTINTENLFIDTETTGLPQTYGFNLFYSYKDISKYKNSRITEICWSNINTTKTHVIKPDNLTEQEILDKIKLIPEHVLKLDIKEIMSGKNLKDVFIEFKNDLRKCKKIIAHNINFDINVIKNEAYILGDYELIELIESKILICTMMKSKNYNNGRVMSLDNLYKYLFNVIRTGSHRSEQDVIDLIKCYNVLYTEYN